MAEYLICAPACVILEGGEKPKLTAAQLKIPTLNNAVHPKKALSNTSNRTALCEKMVLDSSKVVVLDNGSGNIKVGWACDEAPKYVYIIISCGAARARVCACVPEGGFMQA